MGVTLLGLQELTASLRNVADMSSRGVRDALEHGAEDIQKLARLYAPVDEGNLEDSIKIDGTRDVSSQPGRKMFMVYVDLSHPAEGGRSVGEYAERMHETSYNLGPKSAAKEDAIGMMVGPKYLERAVEDLEDEINQKATLGLLKGIGK
jgi:hypothetical protein